jgi:hypothetical protein
MKILFAISVLSFCLLLWAAVGITRHIRRSQADKLSHADPQPIATQSAPAGDPLKSTHRPRYASASSANGRVDRAFTSQEYGDLSYPEPPRPRGPASSTSNPRRF